METSFYADDTTTSSSSILSSFLSPSRREMSAAHERMRTLKKSMTLDLAPSAKRPKFGLLSSPDLNMLKLASPELEKLIIAQNDGQVTTTPTPGLGPGVGPGGGGAGGGGTTTGTGPGGQYIFAKNVTEEQELYARGFVDALAELHHVGTANISSAEGDSTMEATSSGASSQSGSVISAAESGAPISFSVSAFGTGEHASFQLASPVIAIKEEPQIVPSSSESPPPPPHPLRTSLAPIDMMAQERIKLERKRQRNRVAASKCRKRKLERIARLEDKVKLLKDENGELGLVVTKLKDHICGLKQQLMDHVNSGCQIMTPSQYLS